MRRLGHPTIAAALAVVIALSLTPGHARADGPHTPFVVARGHSLFGAPWRVRFGEEPRAGGEPDYATFYFTVGDRDERDEYESGFYSSIGVPLPRAFPFSGTFGSDIDSYPEADFSGTAGPLVKRLVVKMADGSEPEAELLRAPEGLLGRFPRLARFRFFDLFFPAAAEPISVTAFGPHDRVLKKLSG